MTSLSKLIWILISCTFLYTACSESNADFLEAQTFKIVDVLDDNIIKLDAGYEIKLIGVNTSPKAAEYIQQELSGQEVRLILDARNRESFDIFKPPYPVYMVAFNPTFCINSKIIKEGYAGLDYECLGDSLQVFSNYYHDSPMNQNKREKEELDEVNKKLVLSTEKIQKHIHRILTQYEGENIGRNAGEFTQICAAWKHVYENWYYIHDPVISTDTWRSSEESINHYYHNGSKYSGDCDDFAILTAAMAKTIGLSSRFVAASSPTGIGSGHAYAEFFVSNDDWTDAEKEITGYFPISKSVQFTEGKHKGEKGKWVNMDWWAPYVGGFYYPGPRVKVEEDL